jgi:probable F420-dependent oxidoreductase
VGRPFRFGAQVADNKPGKAWVDLARKLEDGGYSTLFVPDHFDDQVAPMPAMTWVAAATSELRVGSLVFDNDFKHPVVLAKEAATLDLLSDGRLELGIGAGWMHSDYQTSGIPFERAGLRIDRLEEAVTVIKGLMSGGPFSFEGTHYTIKDLTGTPKPVQQPHPPILVGGHGFRGTADPAARFADEYNAPFETPESFAAVRAKVIAACERVGRDPSTMRFSTMTGCIIGSTRDEALERARELYDRRPREQGFDDWVDAFAERSLIGSVDEIAARLRDYEQAGCERVMLQHLLHADLEPVRLIGRELAPAVA